MAEEKLFHQERTTEKENSIILPFDSEYMELNKLDKIIKELKSTSHKNAAQRKRIADLEEQSKNGWRKLYAEVLKGTSINPR
jgi:hypothetical protein